MIYFYISSKNYLLFTSEKYLHESLDKNNFNKLKITFYRSLAFNLNKNL